MEKSNSLLPRIMEQSALFYHSDNTPVYLPPEIIQNIFNFFDHGSFIQSLFVSHSWSQFRNDDNIWKLFAEKFQLDSLKKESDASWQSHCKTLAETNNGRYQIGYSYRTTDVAKSSEHFRSIAFKGEGHPASLFSLGYIYFYGEGGEKNIPLALAYFKMAAEKKSIKAHIMLGNIYHYGENMKIDYPLALQYYQKASELASTQADYEIVLMLHHGRGVAKDDQKAFNLCQEAVRKGGIPELLNSLGYFYHYGYGTPINYAKALECYSKAYERGEITAYSNMAILYEHGLGVKKDLKKAFEMCSKGAESGLAGAAHNLGRYYENGIGVAADSKKAQEWYQKARQRRCR